MGHPLICHVVEGLAPGTLQGGRHLARLAKISQLEAQAAAAEKKGGSAPRRAASDWDSRLREHARRGSDMLAVSLRRLASMAPIASESK